jgi:transcriptional regulator with XRE-family HTH domain
VSPLDDIPPPWREAMENAGTYSLRDLATRAGLGTSTVSDLIYGRKLTSERTMQAVSDTLRLPVPTIREWAATARGEVGPYRPPAVANRLSERQRRALDELIRSMVAPVEPEPTPPEPDLSKVQGLRLAETDPTLRVVQNRNDCP